ncbi:AbrB family transcriptional regulator [Prochlorothrix hollandica]|uniref:AbrB family transcriptional regulator n=1 Tax=Prochlorothrix hollandica TaxID=1223 RepID=UPI003341F70E
MIPSPPLSLAAESAAESAVDPGFSWGDLLLQLLLATLGGWLFARWQVPVAWLLGPMALGILYSLVRGSLLGVASPPLPPVLIMGGRSLLGLVAASRFSPETLGFAATYALPLLLCIGLASGLSLINGYLLWRWASLDRPTAFLSAIPGASFGMVAMSEEMGADAIAVTLLQYLRVLMVASLVPNLAHWLFQADTPPAALSPGATLPLDLPTALLLPLCMALGIGLGRVLRLPASGFLGTLVVALVVFSLWSQPVAIPPPLFGAGLLAVGLSIGLRFQWAALRTLIKAVLVDVGLILVLILCCLAIAYGFHQVTQVSTMTAVLGFTPGGLEAMVATVIELGGNTGLVLAMQMTRMFTILLIGPGLVAWLVRRTAPPGSNGGS